jgi:putative (di)nucleoside polyphosphate hydrolase
LLYSVVPSLEFLKRYDTLFLGADADINLAATHQEFASWNWIKPADFKMSWVPRFKRSVYRQVFLDFFQTELEMPRD